MASIGIDTFFAPLSELNAGLKAGEYSAADLAHAFSERLQQLGPRGLARGIAFAHGRFRPRAAQ